jgi:hypothetical protein
VPMVWSFAGVWSRLPVLIQDGDNANVR